jgi:hypothetical protein
VGVLLDRRHGRADRAAQRRGGAVQHRLDHGCINLPLPVAEVLYGWAPLGTPVTAY